MEKAEKFNVLSMEYIYGIFMFYVKFLSDLKVNELTSLMKDVSEEDKESVLSKFEACGKTLEGIIANLTPITNLNILPSALTISPFSFLKEVILIIKKTIQKENGGNTNNTNSEILKKQEQLHSLQGVSQEVPYIIVDHEVFDSIQKSLTNIQQQVKSFKETPSLSTLKDIIDNSRTLSQNLLTMLTNEYHNHIPLFLMNYWLTPQENHTYRTTAMTPDEVEEIKYLMKNLKQPKRKRQLSNSNRSVKVVVKENQEVVNITDDSSEEEYPHHTARKGEKYQADIPSFDPSLREQTIQTKKVYEQVWNPSRLSDTELTQFISQFPQDMLEDVYERIVKHDYDLKKCYDDLLLHPPVNPVTLYTPEDEKRLEDNVNNMALVHHNYFPHVRIHDVVDLFYHMDASFKDDICAICSSGGSLFFCSKCPRGFHKSCIKLPMVKDFICPFCLVTKESLPSNEIDRILTKYKMHLAENNVVKQISRK